jgi:hypothetical protein
MARVKPPDDESLRLELREAITTIRHQIALEIQTVGFIISAGAILVAYGFSQKLSGILLIASFIPIAILLLFIHVNKGLLPVSYVAMKLEKELSITRDPLITTWMRMRDDFPVSLIADIDKLDQANVNFFARQVIPWYLLRSQKCLLVLAVFIGQVCLFITSLTIFHYRFM